jgi:hypothetical protein
MSQNGWSPATIEASYREATWPETQASRPGLNPAAHSELSVLWRICLSRSRAAVNHFRRPRPAVRSVAIDSTVKPRFGDLYYFDPFFAASSAAFSAARAPARMLASHGVIPLVTCVFVDGIPALAHRNHCCPRSCPHRRIFDSELVKERVSVGARETLDQVRVRAGVWRAGFAFEIRRFDNELKNELRVSAALADAEARLD